MATAQVLLVDDNAIQAATRSAILARTGFGVLVAQQGREALDLLKGLELRETLRLLVTDHFMPGMNGPELVRHLRAILPDLPVLVLSGMPGAEAEYADLDVSFRLKPFPPEELIQITRKLVAGSELQPV